MKIVLEIEIWHGSKVYPGGGESIATRDKPWVAETPIWSAQGKTMTDAQVSLLRFIADELEKGAGVLPAL